MGLKLKIRRIERGFKQGELALELGISRYYLSALERGKAKNPSVELMKKISKVLQVPVQELFFED
ncbi:MAG: helix-turn-helix transcriptional regulator [Bacillota bacterium]|nr:helix-turn-helix transcriptional regulator [Bacillota bacterium]